MVLEVAQKFPSLYNKSSGELKPLIPGWAHALLKLCTFSLVILILPQLGGFVTRLVDESEFTLSFVLNTVSSMVQTFALPFARVKLLSLFWKKRDAARDFEEETHIASLAGKQAFARPLTAWLEGIFVLQNGISITSFFDSDLPILSQVFGGITSFFTLTHMIGYIGVLANWLLYRGIADEKVDREQAAKKQRK